MRLAIIFRRLGPYHRVRLEAAGQLGEVWCIEGSGADTVYAWDTVASGSHFHRLTLFPNADSGQMPPQEVRQAVADALDRISPAVVAVPGWQDRLALAALEWAVKARKPAVLMSDSNDFDVPRNVLKEWVKRRIVGLCAAGLVAGTTAANYLTKLGMNRAKIFTGYDAVDNEYFAARAAESRERKAEIRKCCGLPERYFLASARFVEKKNLPKLIEAYARYREKCEVQSEECGVWDLVLLGDGPLREEIETRIADLGIREWVHLAGFKQYDELPAYYGLASAFIHASMVEQWGLVVNEAMASGLPVLVSNRCGCAPDLVQEGVNGFAFNPLDTEQLANLMLRIAETPEHRLTEMGVAGQVVIRHWSPEVFASNLWKAAGAAVLDPQPGGTMWDRIALDCFCVASKPSAKQGARC